MEYAVRLVRATREPLLHGLEAIAPLRALRRQPACGDQPRARRHGRARSCTAATTRSPDDVRDLALDVMRHRLVLSYEALADGVTPDELLHQVLLAVSPPGAPTR